MIHPYPEITVYTVVFSQTRSSMSNTGGTHSVQSPAVEQQLHASGKSVKNYSDGNNLATNFVKKLSVKDENPGALKNV